MPFQQRCMTCAKVLSMYIVEFLEKTENKDSQEGLATCNNTVDYAKILDDMKIYSPCCRRMFYGFPSNIDDIQLKFYAPKMLVTTPNFNIMTEITVPKIRE